LAPFSTCFFLFFFLIVFLFFFFFLFQAITSGVDLIASGQADVIIAAGSETMSDVPIRFSKALRKRMLASQKVKSIPGYLGLLSGLKLKDLSPEVGCLSPFLSWPPLLHPTSSRLFFLPSSASGCG